MPLHVSSTMCSSSGGQNCILQRLVSSRSVGGRPVRTGRPPTECEASNTGTTQTQPHQISNTQRTENKTTDVVIQQHSRKLLMMDILMSETCWVHKKWNKIASDIKLVFYSSTIQTVSGIPPSLFLNGHRCLFAWG